MSSFRKFAAKHGLEQELYAQPIRKKSLEFPSEWVDQTPPSWEEYASQFYEASKPYFNNPSMDLQKFIQANGKLIWQYYEQGLTPQQGAEDVQARLNSLKKRIEKLRQLSERRQAPQQTPAPQSIDEQSRQMLDEKWRRYEEERRRQQNPGEEL